MFYLPTSVDWSFCSAVKYCYVACRAVALVIMGKRIEKAKDKAGVQAGEDGNLLGCVFGICEGVLSYVLYP